MKYSIALVSTLIGLAACAAEERKPAPDPKAKAEAQPACRATPKDLEVTELAAGTGGEVTPRTAVLVHYTGWLFDGCKTDLKGQQFDSSQGRPTPFGVIVGAGRVIKGWDEGLVGMKEKGKRLLVIPPDKAYGEKGRGPIPPNSALVFEVELVQIIQTAPPSPAAPQK